MCYYWSNPDVLNFLKICWKYGFFGLLLSNNNWYEVVSVFYRLKSDAWISLSLLFNWDVTCVILQGFMDIDKSECTQQYQYLLATDSANLLFSDKGSLMKCKFVFDFSVELNGNMYPIAWYFFQENANSTWSN